MPTRRSAGTDRLTMGSPFFGHGQQIHVICVCSTIDFLMDSPTLFAAVYGDQEESSLIFRCWTSR